MPEKQNWIRKLIHFMRDVFKRPSANRSDQEVIFEARARRGTYIKGTFETGSTERQENPRGAGLEE